jgi:hypothetical protein
LHITIARTAQAVIAAFLERAADRGQNTRFTERPPAK